MRIKNGNFMPNAKYTINSAPENTNTALATKQKIRREKAPGMGFEPMRTRRSTGLLAKNFFGCLKARALTTLPSRLFLV